LGEPVQYESDLLEQLHNAGVIPGARASFTAVGRYIRVQVEDQPDGLELPSEVAQHVYVGIK
jgi:DtxR family Mn-dependent transcriptional regulator